MSLKYKIPLSECMGSHVLSLHKGSNKYTVLFWLQLFPSLLLLDSHSMVEGENFRNVSLVKWSFTRTNANGLHISEDMFVKFVYDASAFSARIKRPAKEAERGRTHVKLCSGDMHPY